MTGAVKALKKDWRIGASVTTSGLMSAAFAYGWQSGKDDNYQFINRTIQNTEYGLSRMAKPVKDLTKAELRKAQRNPEALLKRLSTAKAEFMESIRQPPVSYASTDRKINAQHVKLLEEARAEKRINIATSEFMLNNYIEHEKMTGLRKTLYNPKTYYKIGAGLMIAGGLLTAYQAYNKLTEDGAEQGISYAFGRRTAKLAGATLGGLVGGAVGAPLTPLGSLAIGAVLAHEGEEIAGNLYDKGWRATANETLAWVDKGVDDIRAAMI